jgi:hypothetical protein
MRDWPKSRLGHDLAAQPSGATGLRACCNSRAGWRGGVLASGSAVARRRQDIAGDLKGVTGKVPGNEERVGVHRNGGSTTRREESSGTAAFAGEEGAPVVVVERNEVLQLVRGQGGVSGNCKKL